MDQIFVGGWASSGSRVLQQIIERAGYYVGIKDKDRNESYDYLGRMLTPEPKFRYLEMIPTFDRWYEHRDNELEFKAMLWDTTLGKEKWSLKHGQFMLIIPDLKKWYPKSKFILTVRHPIDNLIRTTSFEKYVPSEKSLEKRLRRYSLITRAALLHTDHVVRLEDFCYKPEAAITKLFNILEIDDDPKRYLDIIKQPASLGCRGDTKLKSDIIEMLGYGD